MLHFEGESHYQYRILRSIKNRFGPSGELAVFSMADRGLVEVGNPSEFFLSTRQDAQIGSAVAPILEGSRVLVVELQALVNRSHFGIPQRVASGVNPKKLSLLLAVLERHGGIILGDHDVFFNVAGGLTIAEPAADLGTVAAILSSYRNRPLKKGIALLGEVGLGGEIRAVNNMDLRLRELKRLGFSECLIPPPPAKANWGAAEEGFKPRFVEKIAAMQDFLF